MKTQLIQIPKFSLLMEMFKNPLVGLAVTIPTIPTSIVVDLWQVVQLLCYLFLADLLTGLYASYLEWRKSEKKDRWFFGKGEGFTSEKFKKMFVKLIVYAVTPLAIHKFQQTFLIKNLSYKTISEAEMTLTTVIVLLFCANEFFSIFNENLPKCGFNLWERIKKMINFFKTAKKEIQE